MVWMVVLIACAAEPTVSTTTAPAVSFIATVDHISDGDSFRAGVFEVRLAGVNAPEQDECFGDESRDWLATEIEGEQIQFEIVGVDQFDRSLADVFHENRLINLELVKSGHALALSMSAPQILAGEQEARTNERGMWGAAICGANMPKADLEIVAIDFNPPGNDNDERVTIRNPSSREVDLAGFVLRDESSVNRFEFVDGALPAGAEQFVSTACVGNGSVLTWCTEDPVWNNDGDTALLLDSFGRVVDLYRYP